MPESFGIIPESFGIMPDSLGLCQNHSTYVRIAQFLNQKKTRFNPKVIRFYGKILDLNTESIKYMPKSLVDARIILLWPHFFVRIDGSND